MWLLCSAKGRFRVSLAHSRDTYPGEGALGLEGALGRGQERERRSRWKDVRMPRSLESYPELFRITVADSFHLLLYFSTFAPDPLTGDSSAEPTFVEYQCAFWLLAGFGQRGAPGDLGGGR